MTTANSRVDAFMDRDYRTLSSVEWRMVAEAFPKEFARLLVRLRPAADALPEEL